MLEIDEKLVIALTHRNYGRHIALALSKVSLRNNICINTTKIARTWKELYKLSEVSTRKQKGFKEFCERNEIFKKDMWIYFNTNLLTLRKVESKTNYTKSRGLYIIKCNEFYKIGIASNIKKRLSELSVGSPYDMELIIFKVFTTVTARMVEKGLHKDYKKLKVNGEWFELSDADLNDILLLLEGII